MHPTTTRNTQRLAKLTSTPITRIIQCLLLSLCLTLGLPTRPAHAQTGRTYTTADGLPSNNIQALAYQEDPLDFPPGSPVHLHRSN